MKKLNQSVFKAVLKYSFLLGFAFLITSCTNNAPKDKTVTQEKETPKVKETKWQIKAILPDGKSLVIKAMDKDGNLFDINAIQNSDQDSFLEVKAFVNNKTLPVKMLVNKNNYAPVKAIDRGGLAYDIKAITSEGEKLDVKGIARFGNVVTLKAINKKGEHYAVKAISPSGQLNDVLGVKINIKEKEMTLNGFNIYAHIKALHQSGGVIESNEAVKIKKETKKSKKEKAQDKKDKINIIWNIKAVTLDGNNLDVKAVDEAGNKYDIKAIQDSKQHSFMNVKALVNGNVLPVKVLVSDETDTFSPIKAITKDGVLLDIKAISPEGTFLDVKGVSRSGTIIHIKAINEAGEFYAIKAFSPDGQLNDIKGVKIFDRPTEMKLRGNKVHAHVKALKQ